MATKLKNLHLKKVDVVDEGANPRADIALIKRRESEEGEAEPAAGLFKRFLAWLKHENVSTDEIEKASTSFSEQMAMSSMEDVDNELWEVTRAFRESMRSILFDVEKDAAAKQTAVAESMQQFSTAVASYTLKWTAGQIAGITKSNVVPDLEVLKKDRMHLDKLIAKANEEKGELEEMRKIDKAKMTAEERAAYEAMVAKYAIEVDEPEGVAKKGEEPEVEEPVVDEGVAKGATPAPVKPDDNQADLYKGIIAGLRADIEKMKDEALTRELSAVAKKYEALGKKPEEIIDTLKKAKQAGIYEDVIGVYDEALSAQEASGIFSEIGKGREGGTDTGSEAFQKAAVAVAELKKSKPELTDAQALDQVLLNDPELLKEFDQ